MKPLAVWLDRYAEEACPGLDQALAMRGIVVLRCFERTPNPAASRRLEQYRQAVVLGGKDPAHRAARVELATTTLTWPVVVVAPRGEKKVPVGPGVVDVVEPQAASLLANRIALMSEVPIISAHRTFTPPALGAPRIEKPPQEHAPARRLPEDVRVLALVSSTGGSFVAAELLRGLPRDKRPAVLLAQHLEAEFVPFFAEWLGQASGWRVVVVDAPVPLCPGTVHLAAGGLDLVLEGDRVHTRPATSLWVPSGDVLLRSVAATAPTQAVGVILSGMGSDGSLGLRELVQKGGAGLCQSPQSAVVPSMPERALEQCPTALSLPPDRLLQVLGAAGSRGR